MTPLRGPLLPFKADLRPLAHVGLAFATSLAPFFFAPYLWALGAPRWVGVAALGTWWVLCLYARSFVPYAQHNHGHVPVFGRRWANTAYDAVLTQVTGYPTALWELQHNRGHHRHYMTPAKDVARVVDAPSGRPMTRVGYCLWGNLTILRDAHRIAMHEKRRGNPRWMRKLWGEVALQVLLTALLAWWSPVLTVVYLVVPNMFAGFLVWWESYVHHLHVPSTGTYDGSVTVTDARFNFMNFNIGHHTAHHERPGLHWSLLPARTAAIATKIHPSCVRPDPGPARAATRSHGTSRGLVGHYGPAE